MSIWYASPLGGGTGTIEASPKQLSLLWSLVSAGDTIFLLNGDYTGSSSMIQPTAGLSGTSSAPITIEAINDGGAWIDGEGVRTPVLLQQNDYFILKGFGCYSSNGPVLYIYQSYRVKLQRICAWDAASGNFHVFSGDQSHNLLVEDCAGWGSGRKIFECFNGNAGTFRRCWGEWSENTAGGPCYELSYAATGTTVENCIGTWARTGSAPSGPAGIFGWTGSSSGNDNSKLLGSIAYVRGNKTVDTNLIVCGNNGYVDVDMADVVSYVQPGFHATRVPFSLNNATSASANRITSVGGAADTFGNWTVTNHNDSAVATTFFSGSGAIIGYRYVDRTLTSDPLFPWPMDERIKAARLRGGFASVTDGFTNDTGRITDLVEQLAGESVPAEFEGDPPQEDTELPQDDAPPQDPDIVGSPSAGREWHTLCKIFLDTGTKYYSKKEVEHPSYVYEGRIKSFGFIDRSIPVPSGLPQLSDCRIQIIDTDRALRDVLAHQTPRRRFIEIRNVPEGGSESAYPPLGTFEIYDFSLYDGLVEIVGRDPNFSWIDAEIPGLINRTNFPDLMDGVEEAFLPIIAGVLDAPSEASPPNPQGVLTLPRMTLTRWGLAQHPILYVELCGRTSPSDEFTLISASDYVLTEHAQVINGVPYTMTFVDFNTDQDLALEVRCRIVEGFYTRGEFGTMPAVINSPLTALRNPIDTLINVIYGTLYAERRVPRFNTDSFLYVHSLFETIIQSSPVAPYACDGAIDRPMTIREFLGQWQTSFEVDLYTNRYGEIEVNVTTEEDPERPVFSQGPVFGEATDQSLILYNSVRQGAANPTCNRVRYNHNRNYSTDEWQTKDVYDNEDDQEAMGGADSPPIPYVDEAPAPVEFWWVRESATADDVIARRMSYLALGSYRTEVKLPLPQVFNDVELAKLVGITSVWGLNVDGYQNKEHKTTGLTYDLDQKVLTWKGIIRIPETIDQGAPPSEPVDSFSGDTYIEGLDFGITAQASPATYARSMFYVPQSGYDLANTTMYLEAVVSNLDAAERIVTVYPVLSLGASITVGDAQTITIPASTSGRVRSATPFSPYEGSELYVLQMPAGSNFNLYRIRVVTQHATVTKVASEVYFSMSTSASGLDQTIGGGDIARTTNHGLAGTTSGFTSTSQPRWTYEADRWSTVTRFHFWAVVANASFDQTIRYSEVILYDLTSATYLEDSRLICDDANMFLNPRPFSVDIPITAFTDGHTYEVQFRSVKNGGSDFNTYFHKARGHFYLDPVAQFELVQRCGNATGVVEQRTRYAPTPTTPESDLLVELHGTVGTIYGLRDYGTSDTTTTGTVRAFGEAIIEDSTTKFIRTQDVSQFITQGNRFAAPDVIQASLIHRYPRVPVEFPLTSSTPRQEYIEYLFGEGYMPILSLLFEDGTGTPTEFIRGASVSVGGSGSGRWATDSTYGTVGVAPATTDYWTINNIGLYLPTERATALIIRKKTDSTARSVNLMGLVTDFFGRWFFAYAPQSNGQVRFGVAGNELVESGYSITTNWEAWFFKFGPSGRSIGLNGVVTESDATVLTRTASNSTDDFGINLASSNNPNGDIQNFAFFALIRAEVPDSILSTFTVSNVLLGM